MPPKSTKRARTSRASSSQPPPEPVPADQHFVSPEAASRHATLCARPFHSERGFTVSSRDPIGQDINKALTNRGWTKFGAHPKQEPIPSIVAEFYANLPEARNEKVLVRGREVPRSAAVINRFYETPNIPVNQNSYERFLAGEKNFDDILAVIARPGIRWSHSSTGLRRLKRADLHRQAKAWLYFISARFYPTSSFRHIELDRLYILYAILSGLTLDVGRFIAKRMVRVPGDGDTDGIPFPSLVTALCIHAQVPHSPVELRQHLGKPITDELIRSYKEEPDVEDQNAELDPNHAPAVTEPPPTLPEPPPTFTERALH